MQISEFHLAQVNIAAACAPMHDPIMADFVANLDRINALAENAAGFVWRLHTPEGNATALRVFEDERLIINMSVWHSIEALFDYTYKSGHVEIFRRKAEWFGKMETPHMALWWVPAGHIPTPQEAKERLAHLAEHGATPHAFTFKQRFAAGALGS